MIRNAVASPADYADVLSAEMIGAWPAIAAAGSDGFAKYLVTFRKQVPIRTGCSLSR